MTTSWTRKWPTKPGTYWFHGDPANNGERKTYLGEVYQASNDLMFVVRGTFLFESTKPDCWWMPAVLPTSPSE